MSEFDRIATDRWINVISKNDDKTLPIGTRAQVFVSINHKGEQVEWFKDNHGYWNLVDLNIKLGIIAYE